MKYANKIGWSVTIPFEVIKDVSEKTKIIRLLDAIKQTDKTYTFEQNSKNTLIKIRKHKSGDWKDVSGNGYVISDTPIMKK